MPTKTKEINEENIDNKKAKNITTKKATAKKTSTKKSTTKEVSSTPKTKRKTSSKRVRTKKVAKLQEKVIPKAEVIEYYDLPYRYNETLVKILYQSPDTLFVYWDISDNDRENYIKQYGENFFNITRPVLIVHNNTMNYSFEIPINDFSNSWYLHINDSKCDYKVELGRRPNHYNEQASKEIEKNIHTDYIYVSSSNGIESPNDHVLFSTNENNTIKFRNIKTQKEKSVSLYDVVKQLPVMKNNKNLPYISEELLKEMYSEIYQNKDISLFDKITNPSSGNPSSGSISSRFN